MASTDEPREDIPWELSPLQELAYLEIRRRQIIAELVAMEGEQEKLLREAQLKQPELLLKLANATSMRRRNVKT
jgi:hypothetical protein